jgi:hypothetical protein
VVCLAQQPDVSRTVSSERGEVEQVRRGTRMAKLSKVHPADLRWIGRAGVFAARTAWDHERRELLHMHREPVVWMKSGHWRAQFRRFFFKSQ